MPHEVFISYSHADGDAAQAICSGLERAGLTCWIAPRDVPQGAHYDEEIVRAIDGCRVVVLLLSRHSNLSRHVANEVHLALGRNRTVLPLRLEPMSLAAPLEYQLGRVQWIDAFPPPLEPHLSGLIDRILPAVQSSSPGVAKVVRPRVRRYRTAAVLAASVVAGGVAITVWNAPRNIPPVAPVVVAPELLSLPAGPILNELLSGQPDPMGIRTPSPAIAMEVCACRADEGEFSPLADGASLRSEVDLYVITLLPETAGYLYVVQVDSHGQAAVLFPTTPGHDVSSGENPVAAGRLLQIPRADANTALFLDTQTGTERIYVAFSAARWPRLESLLAQPAPPPAKPSSRPADGVPGRELVLRGAGGVRKMTPREGTMMRRVNDREFPLPVPTESRASAGGFLVIGRQFQHVP